MELMSGKWENVMSILAFGSTIHLQQMTNTSHLLGRKAAGAQRQLLTSN